MSSFGNAKIIPAPSRVGLSHILRWILLPPAYLVGLGIFVVPFFLVFFHNSDWGWAHQAWYLVIGSFLASFGSVALPALLAPKGKQIVSLLAAIITSCGGFYFVASQGDYPTCLFWGYILGGALASSIVFLWAKRIGS
jgi:hypothetical protein